MSYSKTIFMGNLTRDPELRRTQTGKSVCSFSVAVKRRMQDVTDFHDCVAWGRTGEAISAHFYKGKEILVEGELQRRSYEDKSGQKRWVTELNVDTFSFVGRKGDGKHGSDLPDDDFGVEVDSDEELPF